MTKVYTTKASFKNKARLIITKTATLEKLI